jgi:chemotaxis protein CheX
MPLSQSIMGQFNISEHELLQLLDVDVSEIFSTMVGMEVSPTSTPIDSVSKFKDCVTAMVGLAGGYNGLISISTPRKLAMAIASQMLGMEIVEFDDDTTDALGEIANMIGGSFKHHFVKDGLEVRLSTPSVISGEEYVMTAGSLLDTLTLLFETGEGHFMVSVYLETGE